MIVTARAAEDPFNASTFTNATHLENNASSGSFALNDGSTNLTLDLTETVIGADGVSISMCDINSSDGNFYTIRDFEDGGNLVFMIRLGGTQTNLSWLSVLDNGDKLRFKVSYVTSS